MRFEIWREKQSVVDVMPDGGFCRHAFPDFLPHPVYQWRHRLREKLERMDMLRRRQQIEIPEFYPG